MSKLHDLIQYIEHGTALHIGVLFLGSFGGAELELPHHATIHDAPFCRKMKSKAGGQARCYRCRNAALRKAVHTRRAFFGKCINGIYEYTHPVCFEGEVAAILFIGNLGDGAEQTEKTLGIDDCRRIAALLEETILAHLSRSGTKDTLTRNMQNYIEEDLCYAPRLSVMAEIFHYNEKYLGRRFKQQTGLSVSEYRNLRRLERAKTALREGRGSIISIAGELGFDNVTYFNRLFKKQYGCSPTEYKKTR